MKRICEGTLVLLGLALTQPACASHTARHGTTAQTATEYRTPGATNPTQQREDVRSPTMGSIHIDERIVQACGNLPVPHFAFDSAAIHDEAADRLQTVARCFTDGPLKGRTIKLVGRADPRGTEVYNIALGQDRATSVARFLESSGIQSGHVQSMSRGALDATGTDEEGWSRDRRVDILLAD